MYIIGAFLHNLREKVTKHIKSKIEIKEDEKKVLPDLEKKINEALVQSILIRSRSSELRWFTKAVSLIELSVFANLTLLLFYQAANLLDGVKILGAFLAAWLGIKTLISHHAWPDPFVGKAYYYISLFGTLLNVAAGFFLGLFLYCFIFN